MTHAAFTRQNTAGAKIAVPVEHTVVYTHKDTTMLYVGGQEYAVAEPFDVVVERLKASDAATLIAERDALREALEPLAKVADLVEKTRALGDDVCIWARQSTIPGDGYMLTLGHARAARAALATKEPGA